MNDRYSIFCIILLCCLLVQRDGVLTSPQSCAATIVTRSLQPGGGGIKDKSDFIDSGENGEQGELRGEEIARLILFYCFLGRQETRL